MENVITAQPIPISFWRITGWVGVYFFFLFLVPTRSSSSQGNACSSSCYSLKKDLDGYAEEVRRLQSIREKNERFILSLEPDQSSQRMKAESNIRVAHRRVEGLDKQTTKLKEDLEKEKCALCLDSGGSVK